MNGEIRHWGRAFGISVLLVSTGVAAQDADELMACAARNAPERTFSYRADFLTRERAGDERPLAATMSGKREDKGLALAMQVQEPAALAGTAILLREQPGQDDMRIYLPAIQRVRKVTGAMASRELLGTSFSYLNLKQMFGAFMDGSRALDGAVDWRGRPAHRIRIVPLAAEAADFDAVIAVLDAATCVPLTVEFLDREGQLLKRLNGSIEAMTQIGGRHLITEYTMHDVLSGNTTTVRLSDLEFDESIRRSRFSPNSFYR